MLEWAVFSFVTLPIPELVAYLVTLGALTAFPAHPRSPRPPLPRGLPP